MLTVGVHKWALPFFLIFAALMLGCGQGSRERSPCDGFSKIKMGITREDYLPCANKIMAELDRLQPQLKAILKGKQEIVPEAKQTFRELKKLIRQTGVERDHASFRPGREVERWPDGHVRALNSFIVRALSQYGSCLGRPNKSNYNEGSRLHEQAKQIYRRIR